MSEGCQRGVTLFDIRLLKSNSVVSAQFTAVCFVRVIYSSSFYFAHFFVFVYLNLSYSFNIKLTSPLFLPVAYSNSPTTAISSSCAEGFWSYNSACYRYMAIPHSWKDAEASCVTLGAHLTSVHTKLEQDLVYLIASDPGYTPPIWLGLTASKVLFSSVCF